MGDPAPAASLASWASDPVTMALVKRVLDELLGHPPECRCGRCGAPATVSAENVYLTAARTGRALSATRRRARA